MRTQNILILPVLYFSPIFKLHEDLNWKLISKIFWLVPDEKDGGKVDQSSFLESGLR